MTSLLFAALIMTTARAATELYDLPLKNVDGDATTLAAYRGKVLLVVNVASKCGYTRQYAGLQKLFATYESRGLTVLGFPSNDFSGQEPGTNAEIKKFCTSKFDVKFPLFAKAPVTGAEKQPLFGYLIAHAPQTGEVKWNFEKFLISRDGQVLARFDSGVTPDDGELRDAIESALKAPAKK